MKKYTGAEIGVVWMIDQSPGRRVRWTQVKRKQAENKKQGDEEGHDQLEIAHPQEKGILGTVFTEASRPDGKRALFLEDATAHPAYSDEYDFALRERPTPTKHVLVVAIGAPDTTAVSMNAAAQANQLTAGPER